MLVLRDYDHLLTAAAPETVVKTNLSQSLVGHRMAFQIRLRNGGHTTKLVSFADGKMLAMSVLAINLGPDEDMNEKVCCCQHCLMHRTACSVCCSIYVHDHRHVHSRLLSRQAEGLVLPGRRCVQLSRLHVLLHGQLCRCMATMTGPATRRRFWTVACGRQRSSTS